MAKKSAQIVQLPTVQSSPARTAPDPQKVMRASFHGIIDADNLAAGDLVKSGLTMAELSVTAEIVRPTSGPWRGWEGAAERFPYPDPWAGGWMWDEVNGDAYSRQRALAPLSTQVADAKYLQPPKSRSRAYFPPNLSGGWKKVFDDPSIEIDVTEGEKKAAKACQDGFPTIGIGGIWSFKSKKLNLSLISDLDRINWRGRRAVITFDTDPKPILEDK